MRLVVEGWLLAVPAAIWVETLLDLLVKSVLVLAAAHLAARGLAGLPAALKSRIWTLAFALLLALPAYSAVSATIGYAGFGIRPSIVTVIQERASGPAEPALVAEATRGPLGEAAARPTASGTAAASPARFVPAPAQRLGFWPILVLPWLAGVLAVGARTFLGLRAGLRVARNAQPVLSGNVVRTIRETERELGLRRNVALRVGRSLPVPFVAGIFRPTLVLPKALSGWADEQLRPVIVHELAHVRRFDLLRLLVVDLACALCWFNPLAWSGARRARLEIELACDETVVRGTRRAVDYARQLLWFARRAADARASVRLPGMARASGVELRIRALIERRNRTPGWRWAFDGGARGRIVALVTSALVIVLVLPVTAMRFVAQERPAAPRQPELAGGASADSQAPEPTAGSEPDIHQAAAAGDVTRVAKLLTRDPGLLDDRNERGMTPLSLAAWNGHIDLVEQLAERGADVDARNLNGLTPLFCALDRSRVSMARLLMRHGANLETRGYHGRTLLHMAARAGSLGVARDLIERGAEVNALDVRGLSALDFARWNGHDGLVTLLASHGAASTDAAPPSRMRKRRTA